MVNFRRVWAVAVRYWCDLIRSYDRMVDSFYWIVLDMVLWSITGVYVTSVAPDATGILFALLASVILWNVTYRSQADISISLLSEIWSKNLINMFSSPLTFLEWVLAVLFAGCMKAIVSVLFGSLIALVFYHFNIFTLSWHLIPFFLLLILSGWWIGFLVAAIIFRFTSRVQAISWTLVWLVAPLSGIYMPVSALPPWAQSLSQFMPMSYVFEEMRRAIRTEPVSYQALGIALVLNLCYLAVATIIIHRAFQSTLNRGLVKLL